MFSYSVNSSNRFHQGFDSTEVCTSPSDFFICFLELGCTHPAIPTQPSLWLFCGDSPVHLSFPRTARLTAQLNRQFLFVFTVFVCVSVYQYTFGKCISCSDFLLVCVCAWLGSTAALLFVSLTALLLSSFLPCFSLVTCASTAGR